MKPWLLKFLDLRLPVKIADRNLLIPVPPLACILITGVLLAGFISYVELKPEIGANFFFSNDDPQMQEEKAIQKLFPQDPQLIMSVKGVIETPEYLKKIEGLSAELDKLPQVISVQSLSHGPGSLAKAKAGPLWSRVIISGDGKSSLLAVFIEDIDPAVFIPEIESIVRKHTAPDFEILVSGEPYIVELLRRSLFEDLKIFSLAAFLVFGAFFLFFFRSIKILLGTLLTCANASMLTLMISQAVGIQTGMLTANLSTIVFVLTLSHLVFLIFNWREASRKKNKPEAMHPALEAIKMTGGASFWSMLTTMLGFMSLLMVKATPLKQLGAAGSIGALLAFVVAYTLFPLFLSDKAEVAKKTAHEKNEKKMKPFFYRRHGLLFILLSCSSIFLSLGIFRINTDPSLLAYFKKGGELRIGLEYIDGNGGSSPLFMVVEGPEGKAFTNKEGFEKLWDITEALEEDEEVGSAVSLPVIVAQAEKNVIAKMLTLAWLVDLLETKKFGEVAKYFITGDREKALVMLRMREEGRRGGRTEIIDRLKAAVSEKGLETFLIGGVYSLQGRMSKLVASSLISGLSLLLALFMLMAWFLSRSFKIAGAVFVSLLMIPACVLGILGCLGIPLDIISSPAINIAIGMGVDAMIHMLIFVRKNSPDKMTEWTSWKQAAGHFWRPVLYTSLIIGAGFGIFSLSGFPPTQRFGIMVVIGALMAPCTALIAFVTLSSFKFKRAH